MSYLRRFLAGTDAVTPTKGKGATTQGGYQQMIDAESVDEFVHSQTTRRSGKYAKDLQELNEDEKKIERFMDNGEKNNYMNIARYDEVLDMKDSDFYVHANTLKSPSGNFIISQAPLPNTCGDHLHLMWLYNVRTVVLMVGPEQAGGYFSLQEGGTFTVFMKYTMKTIAVMDEKQGITVFQCELTATGQPAELSKRMVYIVCCPLPVSGLRNPRMQTVAMEYMWAFEEANSKESESPTTVLVHGQSGTRRCAAFVAAAIMCKQVLETGKFSSMDTWVEIRKRRCCTCRNLDFLTSIYVVFYFCNQCGVVPTDNQNFERVMQTLLAALKRTEKPGDAGGAGAITPDAGTTPTTGTPIPQDNAPIAL